MFVYISDLSALMPATEVRVLHHTGTSPYGVGPHGVGPTLMVWDLVLWDLPLWCGTSWCRGPRGVGRHGMGPLVWPRSRAGLESSGLSSLGLGYFCRS